MPKKDNLHHFIRAMSKEEKRFFSKRTREKGDENSNYKQLFDAINSMKEYDFKVLEKKFKGKQLLKNLPRERNNLFSKLLETGRSFSNERSKLFKVKELVVDAVQYQEKGLYEKSGKLLQRAKEIAYQYDDYPSIYQILSKQRTNARNLGFNKDDELTQIIDEQRKVILILEKQNKLDYWHDILSSIHRGGINPQDANQNIAIQEIKAKIDLVKPSELESFASKTKYFSIEAIYNLIKKNPEKTVENYYKIIEIWKENPDMSDEFKSDYCIQLMNYISVCIALNNLSDNDQQIIGEIKEISSNRKDDPAKGFQNLYQLLLIYYLYLPDLSEILKLVPIIKKGLDYYGDQIYTTRRRVIINNICCAYFCQEDFFNCLEWLEKQITCKNSRVRVDIRRMSRIIKCISYYELEDFDSFENTLRSTKRVLSKSGQYSFVEENTLNLLTKLKNPNSLNKEMEIFEEYNQILESTYNSSNRNTTWYLQLLFWARSKVNKRSVEIEFVNYLELIKKKC